MKVKRFISGLLLSIVTTSNFLYYSITSEVVLRRTKTYILLERRVPSSLLSFLNTPLDVALIALDKDETLTKARRPLDDFTAQKLCEILNKGIKVLIITGSDAVNTFKCIYLPLQNKIQEYGYAEGILDNLILYCSAGSVAYTFENGERKRLRVSQELLSEDERLKVWEGLIRGVISALRKVNIPQISEERIKGFEQEINEIIQGGGKASEKIKALNSVFNQFVKEFPGVFGEGEKAMHIRDENELSISKKDMEELGIAREKKEDFYAPKITLELSHVPNSTIRSTDFTKIVMEEAQKYAEGKFGLNFKYGGTYVDIARSRDKKDVVEQVMGQFNIGEGAIILGGDSSNDVGMLTMDFGKRPVFRFYVGKKDKFIDYFTSQHGANSTLVPEIIQSYSEEGPKEIAVLFQSIIEGLGDPIREFRFIKNRYSCEDIINSQPLDVITTRVNLIPEAQELLNFLASDKIDNHWIGAPNFTNEDFEIYNPIMLILGSPSPQTFVNAAGRWQQYQKWWEEAGNKGYVPVIASTSRGRGYKELVLNTLRYLERNYPQLFEKFKNQFREDIQEAENLSPEELMQRYEKSQPSEKETMLTEAKVIEFLLTNFGVPEEAIVREEYSNNTFSNMEWSYYLLTGRPHPDLKVDNLPAIDNPVAERFFGDTSRPLKIHVVTDGFHQLRALLTAIAKFNGTAGENLAINGEALYVPDLTSMDNFDLLKYLEHMIGDPYGMTIFDEEGKIIKYGEIERIIKYGLCEDESRYLKNIIETIWGPNSYSGRIYKLRTQLLRNFKESLDILQLKSE